jgi:hypothetical protein
MRPVDLLRPVGHDQQDPGLAQVVGEKHQQVPGGRVGPVRILDHQHQRLALGDTLQDRQHLLEQPRAPIPGVHLGVRLRLAQTGQQAGQCSAAARQQRGDLLGTELADQPPQHRDERRQRQAIGTELLAAPLEHAGAAGTHPVGELADQPRLADPCLPADEHDRRPGPTGTLICRRKDRQLRVPPGEHGTHRPAAHPITMPSPRQLPPLVIEPPAAPPMTPRTPAADEHPGSHH